LRREKSRGFTTAPDEIKWDRFALQICNFGERFKRSARDEAGEALTDNELRDELMTLLIAGHETTATALAWALYWIHKLPAVRDQLVQEMESLKANADSTTVFRLPYLNAVCTVSIQNASQKAAPITNDY
jgi:Cytochrome P450